MSTMRGRCSSAVWRVRFLIGVWGLAFGLWTLAGGIVAQAQVGAIAWGYNGTSGLGDGTATDRFTPIPVVGGGGASSLTNVKAIGAGYGHTVALRNDGSVVAWGDNYSGQLGDGTTARHSIPITVKEVGGSGNITDIKAISVGNSHTVALRTDGSVVAWGWNFYGQLGDGTTVEQHTPVMVKGLDGADTLSNIVAISAGGYHTIALRNDGCVVAWGDNRFGQLGDGTTTARSTPTVVKGVGGSGNLTNVAAIAGGGIHTVVLRTDGSVIAWGDNGNGELGDGTTTNRSTPVVVKGVEGSGNLTDIKAITAGVEHTVALRTNGTAVAWGRNQEGQLGDGTTANRFTPIVVKGVTGSSGTLNNIKRIAAGNGHTVTLRTNGSVVAWGRNSYGQLGDGTTANRLTPVVVQGLGGIGTLNSVKAISAGTNHTVALKDNGLFGMITLSECLYSIQPLTFAFHDPSMAQELFTRSFRLNSDGSFQMDAPEGDYLLAVKGSKWLRKTVPVTIALGTPAEVNLSLIPGDANNDNSVNIFDLATLAEDFNSLVGDANWNEGRSDFNCDDGVDIFDLAVLAEYFNTDGDP